jgi:hypothetical protein
MNPTISSTPSFELGKTRPALEVCFQFVDGSSRTFVQRDRHAVENIRRQINPSLLFSQDRIVVADDYSKSVFVCSQISRVNLFFDDSGFSVIPPDHAELVELDEEEFHSLVPLNQPNRLQKRTQKRLPGDLLVSFLEIRMAGGITVYLMNEALIKLPVENHSFMQRFLSKGAYSIRLRQGGIGVLNLQNLIGYTVYPGVPEIPADAWMAWHKALDEQHR